MQKQSNEVQTDKLSELVRKLEMILGQKNDLGEKIDRAFKDENGIQADPVTAQLSIGEDHLKFAKIVLSVFIVMESGFSTPLHSPVHFSNS